MRVTNSMTMNSTLSDLNRSLARLQRSQTELASGRAIQVVSDDPSGASSAMTIRAQLRRADQQTRAQTDAQGWLATADSAAVGGLELMGRLKELTVRAANSGASGPTAQAAIAAEVGQLREELLTLANTQYRGRYLFNGTAAGPAYDTAGSYVGDAGAVLRDIAPGTALQVNVTGPEAFGDPTAPEGDVFAVVARLQTAIATGDMAALAVEHTNLDAAADRLSTATTQIGARAARLQLVQARTASDEITLRESLATLEDVDIAEALISVKARENAYTAALQAAARVIPPSLLDFMR